MSPREDAKGRICLALDFSNGGEATAFAKRFAGKVGWFKVGLELFVSEGPALVSRLAENGRIFLDLKLHDIPNTAARAAAAAVRTGASMINVHALGARAMLVAAREAVEQEAARLNREKPLLIGVTLLTSIDDRALSDLPFSGRPPEIASRLARLSKSSGLDGVVCSATDLAAIRRGCGDDFLTVVPGIRPLSAEAGDQKRIATPKAALDAGASILVLGRPVTEASDPEAALQAILEEMETV
jgi:orotidine-5'-phosphate decarboxylase